MVSVKKAESKNTERKTLLENRFVRGSYPQFVMMKIKQENKKPKIFPLKWSRLLCVKDEVAIVQGRLGENRRSSNRFG
jgi:hypothetical protein